MALLTLLCLSRPLRRCHGSRELPVELAGDVALEATADLSRGLSLCSASLDVGPGSGTASYSGRGDGVDGAVQRPVTTAVEPMPDDPAATGWDGVVAAQGGARGFVAAAAWVGEADHGLGGTDRSDTVPVDETGSDVGHDGQQLSAIDLELAPGLLQREREPLDLSMTHGMVAAGRGRQLTAAQVRQGRGGQRAACRPTVGVVAGQEERAEPVGLRGTRRGDLLTCDEQDAQRLPVTVGTEPGEPVSVQPQRGQHCKVGVDRVRLTLAP